MQLLILSDVHGNLSALDAVIADVEDRYEPDAMVLLGDNIDYGMRSNEVIARLKMMRIPLICSVWGNHEDAILRGRYDRFSSKRGVECARFTASMLGENARTWLEETGIESGMHVFEWANRRILAVHGSLDDPLWGTVASPDIDPVAYREFDMVLSGHSHIPHALTALAPDETSRLRGKKTVWFINPGSVGQPRNHEPRASFAVWDTERGISLNAVSYDIEYEQSLYDGSVDEFYRERLAWGV